jgi:hypothetical protein
MNSLKLTLLTFLTCFSVNLTALADVEQGREGGGGKGVWDNSKKVLYLYDFWAGDIHNEITFIVPEPEAAETFERYKKTLSAPLLTLKERYLNLDQLLYKILEVRKVDPVFAEALVQAISRLRFEVVPQKLKRTPDLKPPFEWNDEEEVQIATRIGHVVYITKEYLLALKEDNRPGLITHEAIYYMTLPKWQRVNGVGSHFQDYNDIASANRYIFGPFLSVGGFEQLRSALDSGRDFDLYRGEWNLPRSLRGFPDISISGFFFSIYDPGSLRGLFRNLGLHQKEAMNLDLGPNLHRLRNGQLQFNPAIVIIKTRRAFENALFIYLTEEPKEIRRKLNNFCQGLKRDTSFHIQEVYQELVFSNKEFQNQNGQPQAYLATKMEFRSNYVRSYEGFSSIENCQGILNFDYGLWYWSDFFRSFE